MDDRLVWIDCEMTGLDPARDRLLEVACIVTDSELTPLDEGMTVVIGADEATLAAMDPVVQEMHAASGLDKTVLASTTTVEQAEELVLAYVKLHVAEARKAPLCGNSIATDRGFIAREMAALDAFLHYRMVDVSSVKELARRWYPRVYFSQPKKDGGHRALADIKESIRELVYYRATLFVPLPGPDTTAAQAIAAELAPVAPAITEAAG